MTRSTELTPQDIETVLVFLGRADLKGVEVQAFIGVTNKLNAMRAQAIAAAVAPVEGAAPDTE